MLISTVIRSVAKKFPKSVSNGETLFELAWRLCPGLQVKQYEINWLLHFDAANKAGFQLATCLAIADLQALSERIRAQKAFCSFVAK